MRPAPPGRRSRTRCAEFEPVSLLVDPGELSAAKRYVSQDIEIVEAPLNDAWMRDIGPTFVHAEDGSVAAVDWVFNGWGGQDWARWDRDAKVGALIAEIAAVPLVSSPLVNEGGGIQVDGQGTVLVTDTVQLDPRAQPGPEQIGRRSRTGPHHRRHRGGPAAARTHPRLAARSAPAATSTSSPRVHRAGPAAAAHPDRRCAPRHRGVPGDTAKTRRSIRDHARCPHRIPSPMSEGYVDYSDINHLVVNGGVIACSFGDPRAMRTPRRSSPSSIRAARWCRSMPARCSPGAAVVYLHHPAAAGLPSEGGRCEHLCSSGGAIWTGYRHHGRVVRQRRRRVGGRRQAHAADADERVDLAGGFLMPVLGDGHAHPPGYGGLESVGPRGAALHVGRRDRRGGQDLRGCPPRPGMDRRRLVRRQPGRGGLFDARWLDAAVPDRPVVLRVWDYHTFWVNSAALRLSWDHRRHPGSGPSERSRAALTGRCSALCVNGAPPIWSPR